MNKLSLDEEQLFTLRARIICNGVVLTEREIAALIENVSKPYSGGNEIFALSMECLSLGSDYVSSNARLLIKLLDLPLEDYDLGIIMDSISYAKLTKHFLNRLLKSGSFSAYSSGWEYSCHSAINALTKHVCLYADNDIYQLLKHRFDEALRALYGGDGTEEDEYHLASYCGLLYSGLVDIVYARNTSAKLSLWRSFEELKRGLEQDGFTVFPSSIDREVIGERALHNPLIRPSS